MTILLLIVVASLPFELRIIPFASNLQWLFVATAVSFVPTLIRKRQELITNKVVLAALLFVSSQWWAAAMAVEFKENAVLGAVRVTMGFVLLCVTLCADDRRKIMQVWAIAASVAAVYALLDYYGFGWPSLFRAEEFWVGPVKRLSGSFDYPNTAAAYFALSLPIVWFSLERASLRIAGAVLLWVALVLTYSRGAIIAVSIAILVLLISERSRRVALLAAICAVAFGVLVMVRPSLPGRFRDEAPLQAFASEVQPQYTRLRIRPGESGEMELHIKNVGTSTWIESEGRPFTISYRWYDPQLKKLVQDTRNFATIPTPLPPQQSVTLRVPFTAPNETGLRLMTWDISQHGQNWFSGHGAWPGLIEVDIDRAGEPLAGQTDLSRWFGRDTSRLFVASTPFARTELWRASWGMAMKRPLFGVGPDNFRLLYGQMFGLKKWDAKIRANSLYLELLSGSGFAGLLTFCVLIGVLPWKRSAAALALGIFLLHGVVDAFLMTTPIYFAFWILIAIVTCPVATAPGLTMVR